ncbi:MAG: methyltransferase domain-containing protein [Syntrophomonas sp.]|nr:methyltransferase domain-containing protein [Syntrophomonas sp.]
MNEFSDRFKKAVKANFNQSKDHYLELEEKYAFFLNLTDRLLSEIVTPASWLRRDIKILDVGCGTGSSIERILKAFPGAKIEGLDLSEKMLDAARNSFPDINYVCGDGEKLSDYYNDKFDLIVYPASLFIMPDQEQSLTEAHKILHSEGIVAASVLLGLREDNNVPLENLPSFKGIIKNDELPNLFNKLFKRVTVSKLEIPLDRELASAVYQIEALSAGAFPGKPYEERLEALDKLLDEVEEKGLRLVQGWLLIVGFMQ